MHLMSATRPELVSPGVITLAEGMVLYYDTALVCEIETHDPVGMNTAKNWGTNALYRIKLISHTKSASYTMKVAPRE